MYKKFNAYVKIWLQPSMKAQNVGFYLARDVQSATGSLLHAPTRNVRSLCQCTTRDVKSNTRNVRTSTRDDPSDTRDVRLREPAGVFREKNATTMSRLSSHQRITVRNRQTGRDVQTWTAGRDVQTLCTGGIVPTLGSQQTVLAHCLSVAVNIGGTDHKRIYITVGLLLMLLLLL